MKECEKCTLQHSSYCPNERGEPCYGFAETADNADSKVEPEIVNTESEEVRTVTYDERVGFLSDVLTGLDRLNTLLTGSDDFYSF